MYNINIIRIIKVNCSSDVSIEVSLQQSLKMGSFTEFVVCLCGRQMKQFIFCITQPEDKE